jgi:ketosteroid isomerase-like protein
VTEANVEIARRAYAAFSHKGVEGILAFLDPEIEWRMWERFARGPRVFHGHQGVREVLSIFAENYDDFTVEPLEFIDAGESVVVPVRLSGRAKGSGEQMSFELVQVWTARDDRASQLDVYDSREQALSAVGLGSDPGH